MLRKASKNWHNIYTSKIEEDKLEVYENTEVINLIIKKYPSLQMGYIPEYYDVAFLLIEENIGDSFEDKWKIVFFKKALNTSDIGTITLDNIDMMNDTSEEYEIYKTLDGSFENVINISCDLITKHKANIQEYDDESETSKAREAF